MYLSSTFNDLTHRFFTPKEANSTEPDKNPSAKSSNKEKPPESEQNSPLTSPKKYKSPELDDKSLTKSSKKKKSSEFKKKTISEKKKIAAVEEIGAAEIQKAKIVIFASGRADIENDDDINLNNLKDDFDASNVNVDDNVVKWVRAYILSISYWSRFK